jgi:hypothetical protein
MKREIFNQYLNKVLELFGIVEYDLFKVSKCRETVDARQLLYYLCHIRQIDNKYIQKYLQENGFNIYTSNISRGISNVKERIKKDKDYVIVVNRLKESVSI